MIKITILGKLFGKVKKYNKIQQGFKKMISNFACFLTAIVSV